MHCHCQNQTTRRPGHTGNLETKAAWFTIAGTNSGERNYSMPSGILCSQLQPRDPANTIVDPKMGSNIKKPCQYIDFWNDFRPWLGTRGLAYLRPNMFTWYHLRPCRQAAKMICQFSTYLVFSGIICFVHLCSGQQFFAVIPKFQLSFNGHTWLRLHLHRQKKNQFWFLHVLWLLFYCWLLFSHQQGGRTFEGVFCTGENKWGTWIYSDIRLVWQPLEVWYQFAFDLFLLWRPFALTLLCFDIPPF